MPKTETEKEIIVKRDKLNIYTCTFMKDGTAVTLKLMPGMNRIKDPAVIECISDKKICEKTPWQDLLDSGVHKIITGKKQSEVPGKQVFSAMDLTTAKQVISETYSVQELELMYADEEKHKSRKGVLDAIKGQIEHMKSEDAGKNPVDHSMGAN